MLRRTDDAPAALTMVDICKLTMAAVTTRPQSVRAANDAEMLFVRSDWLYGCPATSVDCEELTHVTSLGSYWLYNCADLTAVDCSGLTQLTTVGDHWLSRCGGLTYLDCTALTQLVSVNDHWLFTGSSLTTLDCSCLASLATVGIHGTRAAASRRPLLVVQLRQSVDARLHRNDGPHNGGRRLAGQLPLPRRYPPRHRRSTFVSSRRLAKREFAEKCSQPRALCAVITQAFLSYRSHTLSLPRSLRFPLSLP